MLNMIPNYNFSDEYERTRIIKAYSSNAIWQLIALLFVSVIDLVVRTYHGACAYFELCGNRSSGHCSTMYHLSNKKLKS